MIIQEFLPGSIDDRLRIFGLEIYFKDSPNRDESQETSEGKLLVLYYMVHCRPEIS